jgi:Protein of unknown function (DUF3078)
MIKSMLLFLIIASPFILRGQNKEVLEGDKEARERAAKLQQDTTKPFGWTHKVVTGLNFTQVSYKDWTQGGQNALAYTLWLNGSSIQDMEKTNWSNSYKFAFGQARLSGQGLRKTDDEIFLESLLIYKLWTYINPYASFTMRTQFARGYEYPGGNEVPVSKFFDPAYLTQSLGAAYKPIPEVTTRLGVGVREIVTSDFNGYADDPTTPEIEKVRVNGGIESVTDAEWDFAENLQLKSKLEMFAAFNSLDEIIVRSDNTITAKVNKFVTVGFNVLLVNDVTASRKTQIKEVLAIGVSYTLL